MQTLTNENTRLLTLDRIGRAAHRCGELSEMGRWSWDEQEEAERLSAFLSPHGIEWRLSTPGWTSAG